MSFVTVFIIFAVSAYAFQIFLGFQQLRHFNGVYQELRRKGKVAIGRRPGKIRSGTIVMFAIEDEGKIIDARLMQGVTVASKFKALNKYVGQDIHYIDKYHPLVQKENKLTQFAMENAREIYLRVAVGDYKEEPAASPFKQLAFNVNLSKNLLMSKFKRSV
ncbi:transcriptional regulator GutM [Fundicoccus sp. Sow4_F4]|uniref:transcriptional regulator GutM n=1 Tax=Fundicoccus sp. Sow4_F4 TaxID=3438783 RepID=UPI003F91B873